MGGTCNTTAETLIKIMFTACLFHTIKDYANISNIALNRATGSSCDQFSQACIKVKELLDNYYIKK